MKKNSLYLSLLLAFVLGMTACGSDNSTNASVENPVLGTNSSSSGSGTSNKNDSKVGSFYNPAIAYGQLIDARDGNVYRTVQIGSQVWMAQNLNYNSNPSPWDTREDYYALYGRLYTLKTALTVCPVGWHLPSIDEWKKLYSVVGENPYALVTKKWNNIELERGTDDYGVSIFPCSGTYAAVYWSSTTEDGFLATVDEIAPALCFKIIANSCSNLGDDTCLFVRIEAPSMNAQIVQYSVRCVQD